MSAQSAKVLQERFDTDPDFRRRLNEASTADERKQILDDAGMDVDQSELETILRRAASPAEIPDEELDKIAGGVTENRIDTNTTF